MLVASDVSAGPAGGRIEVLLASSALIASFSEVLGGAGCASSSSSPMSGQSASFTSRGSTFSRYSSPTARNCGSPACTAS
jgi:hypothetical protein